MMSYTFTAFLFAACAIWTNILRGRHEDLKWLGAVLWLVGLTFVASAFAGAQDVLTQRTASPDPTAAWAAVLTHRATLVAHAAWIALLVHVSRQRRPASPPDPHVG